MRRFFSLFVALLGAASLVGCGGAGDPGDEALPDGMGGIEISISGHTYEDDNNLVGQQTLAYIAIRDVFDQKQIQFLECIEKEFDLPGSVSFCDQLLVLEPGVYEVHVQPTSSHCVTKEHHYKVHVKKGKTEELMVELLCGKDSGGLDVIVIEERRPLIKDIEFEREGGLVGNKFMCVGEGREMTVRAKVLHPDDCENLSARFDLFGMYPAEFYPEEWFDVALYQDGEFCIAEITIPLQAPVNSSVGTFCDFLYFYPDGGYDIKVTVTWFGATEGQQQSSSLKFPLYLVDCEDYCKY